MNNEKTRNSNAANSLYAQSEPSVSLWSTIVAIILLVSAVWHLENLIGWFTGDVLANLYGMEANLAEAIAACPYILFYATYVAAFFSAAFLVIVLVLLYMMITGRLDETDVLTPTMLCTIVSIWLFPIAHVVADLIATVAKVRDTSGFDVFQLGIDMIPMLAITAVCCFVIIAGKRINMNKR